MPSDGKMANTMTAGGLRAAGQVELAASDAPPNWARAAVLLRHLRQTFPGLAREDSAVSQWMGCRPSTPDGLPVIGPARGCADIVHAFGHGHVGLAHWLPNRTSRIDSQGTQTQSTHHHVRTYATPSIFS
jgi:D-amino-acid dehydrogenase